MALSPQPGECLLDLTKMTVAMVTGDSRPVSGHLHIDNMKKRYIHRCLVQAKCAPAGWSKLLRFVYWSGHLIDGRWKFQSPRWAAERSEDDTRVRQHAQLFLEGNGHLPAAIFLPIFVCTRSEDTPTTCMPSPPSCSSQILVVILANSGFVAHHKQILNLSFPFLVTEAGRLKKPESS